MDSRRGAQTPASLSAPLPHFQPHTRRQPALSGAQRRSLSLPQVWRRADTLVKLNHETGHGYNTMDQALLNDAINAAGANISSFSWPSIYQAEHKDHPFWLDHDRGNKSFRGPGRWYEADFEKRRVEEAWMDEPVRQCGESCATPLFAWQRRQWATGYSYKEMRLSIPLDAPERALPGGDAVETFAAGPPWTFGHQEDEYRQFEISAITHLVGCDVGFRMHGGSHAGRRALMAAAGAWTKAPLDRTYATLAPQLVTKEDLATKKALAGLIQRFVAAAHELDRMPAMFGFECRDAPWVLRRNGSRLGVYDLRVIKHGDLCFAGVGGPKCNHVHFVYIWEIEHHGLPSRTVDGFHDAAHHPTAPVMHLRHLPETFDVSKVKKEFRDNCPDYFERLDEPEEGLAR